MRDQFSLAGKTAIVTGAARGLVRVLAKGLATRGASVVLGDNNLGGIQATARSRVDFSSPPFQPPGATLISAESLRGVVREMRPLCEEKEGHHACCVLHTSGGSPRRAPGG